MPRPTVDQLHHSGRFSLLESFHIDEMTLFIFRELGMKPPQAGTKERPRLTVRSVVVFLLMAGVGGVVGYFLGHWLKGPTSGASGFWQLLAVLPLLLVLLVVHEGIHALVFLGLGARDVGFGYSRKGLMVYAYSQRFVMTLRENALVAAMPFLVLTTGLALALVLLPEYRILLGLTLLLHTFGCLGDFALIRHWWKVRHRAMYTYDDLTEKRTYFFEEKPAAETPHEPASREATSAGR